MGQHRLRDGTQILGRAVPDITLAANDMNLSRRHASVVVSGGTVYVRDLNSANGTFLKVDVTARLAEGDVLRLGHQTLRFGLSEAMVRSEGLAVDTGRFRRRQAAPTGFGACRGARRRLSESWADLWVQAGADAL